MECVRVYQVLYEVMGFLVELWIHGVGCDEKQTGSNLGLRMLDFPQGFTSSLFLLSNSVVMATLGCQLDFI